MLNTFLQLHQKSYISHWERCAFLTQHINRNAHASQSQSNRLTTARQQSFNTCQKQLQIYSTRVVLFVLSLVSFISVIKMNHNAVLLRTFQLIFTFLLQFKQSSQYRVTFSVQSCIGFSDFLPQDSYLFSTLHCLVMMKQVPVVLLLCSVISILLVVFPTRQV